MHAFEKAFDIGIGFSNFSVPGIKKVALTDGLNRASDVAGIIGSKNHARPADDQAPIRRLLLPTLQDKFGSQLGDAVRGVGLGKGRLIRGPGGGTVWRNAGHKKNVFAANLEGVAGHIDGSQDICFEILFRLVSWFTVNGGEEDDPVRLPWRQIWRNRRTDIAKVGTRIHEVCRKTQFRKK